ncbi:hypothetical protein AB0I94_30340 [Streptomyces sp. NPDC050147]|uniref:hypothetical protein n=1 Tax=Streptomyces sp. NPDC050147 TaxID=3155513 RepID=UPI00342AE3D5
MRSARRVGAVAMVTAALAAGALGASAAPAAANADTRPGISHTGDTAQWAQERPAPRQQRGEAVDRQGSEGELAEAGSESDTMLYAGLAISLCVLGALAVAAVRSRRD